MRGSSSLLLFFPRAHLTKNLKRKKSLPRRNGKPLPHPFMVRSGLPLGQRIPAGGGHSQYTQGTSPALFRAPAIWDRLAAGGDPVNTSARPAKANPFRTHVGGLPGLLPACASAAPAP